MATLDKEYKCLKINFREVIKLQQIQQQQQTREGKLISELLHYNVQNAQFLTKIESHKETKYEPYTGGKKNLFIGTQKPRYWTYQRLNSLESLEG